MRFLGFSCKTSMTKTQQLEILIQKFGLDIALLLFNVNI